MVEIQIEWESSSMLIKKYYSLAFSFLDADFTDLADSLRSDVKLRNVNKIEVDSKGFLRKKSGAFQKHHFFFLESNGTDDKNYLQIDFSSVQNLGKISDHYFIPLSMLFD